MMHRSRAKAMRALSVVESYCYAEVNGTAKGLFGTVIVVVISWVEGRGQGF